MTGIHKIIWVTLFSAVLAFLVYAQAENQEIVGETADTSLVISAVESDTLAVVHADSTNSEQIDDGNLFSNLIKPILFIGIIGGVLILLYTQRGN